MKILMTLFLIFYIITFIAMGINVASGKEKLYDIFDKYFVTFVAFFSIISWWFSERESVLYFNTFLNGAVFGIIIHGFIREYATKQREKITDEILKGVICDCKNKGKKQ